MNSSLIGELGQQNIACSTAPLHFAVEVMFPNSIWHFEVSAITPVLTHLHHSLNSQNASTQSGKHSTVGY